jgi:hypothetical protein
VLLAVIGFSLVHANVAMAQVAVAVTPPADVNTVGTPHTVTIRVTGCAFPNLTCAGVKGSITIAGGGNPVPASGGFTTNSAGQATFTFTNTIAVTNTITARVNPSGPSGTATKTWVAGPPTSITLLPSKDENVVGQPHTVTATVRDQFGNPVAGDPVVFTVTRSGGGGAPTPPGATSPTNTAGQATFTYTNTVVGVDTITARETIGGRTATAAKTWIAGPAARLTLSPATATNPVGTQHCVTALVTDAFGNPRGKVTVRFFVTGSVTTSGMATTDDSGRATFCYIGPPLPGADSIRAFADTNNNGMQDAGEPSGMATKTWVLPMSTPGCEVKITNGGWIIARNGDRSSFGGNAKVDADGNVSGNEEYQDHGPAQPMNLHGNVLVVQCTSATSATIYGQATIGGTTYFYRLNVEDNAEPGQGADKYWMLVGNGYDSGNQILQGGNVQIHQS